MKRIFIISGLILTTIFSFTSLLPAQTKNRKPIKKVVAKKAAPPAVIKGPVMVETIPEKTPVKKNERPAAPVNNAQEPQKKNQSPTRAGTAAGQAKEAANLFVYEFTQPNFVVSRIVIEHDEAGKGKITFEKKGADEAITDPLELSALSLEKIKNLFQTLNFIDSTEDYQSTIRQYGHLGTMKLRVKKDGRERAAEFNWTENKDAKALADEYRKIGEQFVWIFDMSVARENQPLEAPSLMDRLDSLLKRDQISDPPQMLPLLKKLSDDERIPLIARNHASRMVKEIEKKASNK